MIPHSTYPQASTSLTLQTRLADLFSFEGRLGRQQYWMRSLLLSAINFACMVPVTIAQNASTGMALILSIFVLAVYLVTFWGGLATTTKRLHDRGRSGWFLLIALVPLVGLWVLVEVGFLRGDESPNQYGDPVA